MGSAQVLPIGVEFQVNSYTTGEQMGPDVASDGQGGFVVVWLSEGSDSTDTSATSIQARRYGGPGNPLGEEFQVNTTTTDRQLFPAVAADGQGNFVVTWLSDRSAGTDSSSFSVQAQRFDASGTAVGSEFQVNTYTTGEQTFPSVAVSALGDFVIAWHSEGSTGSDNFYFSIQAQRFAADGTPLGGEFQVNTYTTSAQSFANVATDSQGNFIVVWQSLGSGGTDQSFVSVQAQRFAATGTPIGGQFQVNTATTSLQGFPVVATNSDDGFVVVWTSWAGSGTDTIQGSVQAQRFDANGAPLGGEFQVNTYTTGDQDLTTVAVDAQGTFTVAWEGYGSNGTDSSVQSVHSQRYAADGTPIGGETQMNTYTTSLQRRPAVAATAQGDFVVAWFSDGSLGLDSSGPSVQARRVVGCLFCDGVESGDTSPWSLAVP